MVTGSNIENLYFKSKTVSLIILAATAMICSRALFLFFNDPEGPNLLIVAVLALVVFLLSSSAYLFVPIKIKGVERLSAVIPIQIAAVIVFYFLMK